MHNAPNIPFDSRDEQYKQPFGAIPNDQSVHFKVCLPRSLKCSSCKLFVNQDGGYTEHRYEMLWSGCDKNNDDYEWWECHQSFEQVGLYWYRFDLTVSDGFMTVSRTANGKGILGDKLDCWQLTVYDKQFETPSWLKGGIIYQIFPDRFYNSGIPKADVPNDRILHKSWEEEPKWQPDSDGEIRNNDYFGGDLKGIEQKLPYLKQLGVSCIYLNPIFQAHSNHRYNTADYSKIDWLLGNNADFEQLCKAAASLDIRIILDGVFSHTGSDSIYFNREGRYGNDIGAYNDESSPYYKWYKFGSDHNDYECWWGFITLPDVDENCPEYLQYITGDNGIIQKWLKLGASGWRLDVADELPDNFLQQLRKSVKAYDKQAVIIGEVWEDASNKISYNQRRRFIMGNQLDSVMNYPFRNAVIDFMRNKSAEQFTMQVMNICENYPKPTLDILMNLLGTHDTERILTALGGQPKGENGRPWQAATHMTPEQASNAKHMLRIASVLQYTLPGVPSLYYGDEAGMAGYCDPFNRHTYPWGKEDKTLISHFAKLGQLRNACPELTDGRFVPHYAKNGLLSYLRVKGDNAIMVIINLDQQAKSIAIPTGYAATEQLIPAKLKDDIVTIAQNSYAILRLKRVAAAEQSCEDISSDY